MLGLYFQSKILIEKMNQMGIKIKLNFLYGSIVTKFFLISIGRR